MGATIGWQYCREDDSWCRIPIVCFDADDAAQEASQIIFHRVGGAVDWEPDTEKEIQIMAPDGETITRHAVWWEASIYYNAKRLKQ